MYHGTNVAASEGESLGDALASLLNDGLWSIVLGEPTDDRFECDEIAGWGTAVASGEPISSSLPPPSMFRPADEVAAQLSRVAPMKPSKAELATGCGPSALACVVVAAHRTSPEWAHSAGLPVVSYKREVVAARSMLASCPVATLLLALSARI